MFFKSIILALLIALCFSSNVACLATDSLSEAIALFQKKDYKNAAESFRGLAKGEQAATAHYYMAICYTEMGYKPQAKVIFERLVQLWPQSQEAKYAVTYLSNLNGSPAGGNAASASVHSTDVNAASVASSAKAVDEMSAKMLATITGHAAISRAEWQTLPQKTRIPIHRERGHLWITAKVNGQYCKMIFDTGASICTLSLADFPNLIPASDLAKAKTSWMARTYGRVQVKELVTEISLQDITRKVDTCFIGEKGCSVLGQNFFKEYTYEVDDYYLRLTKAPFEQESAATAGSTAKIDAAAKKRADKYSIPFEVQRNIMLVNIEVNGHPAKACFDTGCAPDGIVCHPSMNDSLGIRENAMADRVVIGHMILSNVRVFYARGIDHILIGPKIFNRPYTVDQQAQRIRFDY